MVSESCQVPGAGIWNLTLETEIRRNTLLQVAYVGTAERNLEQDVQENGPAGKTTCITQQWATSAHWRFTSVALRDYDQPTYGHDRLLD